MDYVGPHFDGRGSISELVDYVGKLSGDREVTLIGSSMGGMLVTYVLGGLNDIRRETLSRISLRG